MWNPPQESKDYKTLEYLIRNGIERSELSTRTRRPNTRTSFKFSKIGIVRIISDVYVSRMNVLYMYVVAGVPYEVRVVAATNGGLGEESRVVFFLEELGKI